jgi:hypothetical protein
MPISPDELDDDDPFEIDDDNRPHLVKHGFDETDLYEVWDGVPAWAPDAKHPGRLKLHGPVPGAYLVVPCDEPKSGDPRKCRPITIFEIDPPQ